MNKTEKSEFEGVYLARFVRVEDVFPAQDEPSFIPRFPVHADVQMTAEVGRIVARINLVLVTKICLYSEMYTV